MEIRNSEPGTRNPEPGTLELWNIGTLEHWNFGTLEPQTIININNDYDRT
jgi:hypothetical protein